MWCPDAAAEAGLAEAVTAAIGDAATVEVRTLDGAAKQAYEKELGVPERRLAVECSQRPGLILAITELLAQQGCLIPKIDTSTSGRRRP